MPVFTSRMQSAPRRGALVVTAIALSGCSVWDDWFGGAPSSHDAFAVSTQRALEFLPDGESLDWIDPETQQPSRVTVVSTTQGDDGVFCRDIVYDGGSIARPLGEVYCRDEASERWIFESAVED